MKKSLLLLLFMVASMATWAVDWSGIDWVTNGTSGDYANKYKFYTEVTNLKVVNIQKPGFATADGFYITLPDAAFTAVKDGDTALTYDQQGAGICLHVDNFTKVETQVDVYNGDELRWTFYIYYPSAFVAEATEFGIVGECNSWSASENYLTFYTTADSKVIKATADSFTTGQWGFKVRKGTGWDNLYGCSNAISTGKAETLDGNYNIHLGQAQNNVTLTNVTFTVTLDDAGVPATIQIDADQTVSTASFHDKYIIVGTQTGWSLENDYIEFEYQSDGSYKATVDRFQGDLKVLKKDGTWNTQYGSANTLVLGDNTLTKNADNASFASGMILKNGTFTLTFNADGTTANLNIAGTLTEEHSYGLVGAFESWNMTNAPLFTEQADGTYTYDATDFPGASAFKVSIDKSWTCFLAQSGVTSLPNGAVYTCARANNDNNLTLGESGKTYNAHFVLDPENATLTVTYFSADDYTTLTNGDNTIKVLPVYYTATGKYVLTITSETAITGLGGSFWHVNGEGTEQLSVKGASSDEYTYVVTTTSTTDPQLYTPLYVMMPGEVNFGQPTFDWISVGGVKVTVNSNVGYATMYYNDELTTDDDVNIYTGAVSGDKLVLTKLASKTIPAKTAVLVDGDATFNYAFTGATVSGTNDLKGVNVDTETSTLGTILVLGYVDNTPGFYTYTGTTLGAHKAYLEKSGSAKMSIVFDDEVATGIDQIENGELKVENSAIYNLAGQRVNANHKGIVIVNGKKYLNK